MEKRFFIPIECMFRDANEYFTCEEHEWEYATMYETTSVELIPDHRFCKKCGFFEQKTCNDWYIGFKYSHSTGQAIHKPFIVEIQR